MEEPQPVHSGHEYGPRILSVYDGFFSGGARILHTDAIRSLDATTSQSHSVLSLHNQVRREFTIQPMERDTCYKRLSAAGIAIRALNRQSVAGVTAPYSAEDLTLMQYMADNTDVILSLKEQPLTALDLVDTGDTPIVACLHRSDPEHQGASLDHLRRMYEVGKLAAAICCARSTQMAYYEATGIPLRKLPVIPNGVNLFKFQPSVERRVATREELDIPTDAPTILFAARFDEMKNVPLFVQSAALFARARPDAHFVMCGAGMTEQNTALTELLTDHLGEQANVHLMGIRPDMPRFYAATDIVALTSSFGEAAPLCLLEGMACGAIPVTTNVGDSAAIVRNPDLVTTNEPDNIAMTWAMAYESREFLQHQILSHRHKLSSERTFDGYHRLITRVADRHDLLPDDQTEALA